MPNVSVIIATYNCDKFLPETLDSVLAQTYQDFEIIIIDDGSTDNTKAVVEAYIQKYHSKIRYIHQQNGGPASARNNGIRNANGKYIALLDSDDLWAPDKLAVQIDFLDKNPQCQFAYSDLYAMDESGKIGNTFMRFKTPKSGDIFFDLLRENFIASPTPIVLKECFGKAGYFWEDRDIISVEDHHLWLKIANFYQGGFIDKPLAYYRIRTGSLSSLRGRLALRDIKVIEKIASEFPDRYLTGRKYFNKALSVNYFEAGFDLYRKNEFKEALKYFILSIKQYPFYFKPLKLILVIMLFPNNWLRKRNASLGDESGFFAK